MLFYKSMRVQSYANAEKAREIIASFQRRATRIGGAWRDLMYGEYVAPRGVDPRDADRAAKLLAPKPAPTPGEADPLSASFDRFDVRRRGYLGHAEVTELLKSLGFQASSHS